MYNQKGNQTDWCSFVPEIAQAMFVFDVPRIKSAHDDKSLMVLSIVNIEITLQASKTNPAVAVLYPHTRLNRLQVNAVDRY